MPMPRRRLSTGNSGRGISTPNSSREIMRTMPRVRTVEPHALQLDVSRSNAASGASFSRPQMLQRNKTRRSGCAAESEDVKDGSPISVVDGGERFGPIAAGCGELHQRFGLSGPLLVRDAVRDPDGAIGREQT